MTLGEGFFGAYPFDVLFKRRRLPAETILLCVRTAATALLQKPSGPQDVA